MKIKSHLTGRCEPPRAWLGPLLLGTAALILGVPSYLMLERRSGASAAILDEPWPLWVAEAFLVLLCVRAALRGGNLTRRLALGSIGVALASGSGSAVFAKRNLPEPSAEIAVGQSLPDAHLPDELGRSISLGSLRGHPTVLLFYRGALCVACRAQLSRLAARAGSFIAGGVRVYGVSADPPSVSAEWKAVLGLPFSLLSDERQTLAQSLCSSRAHCVVLVDPQGKVRWGALNDYWRGAEDPGTLLLAAYRLGWH